MVLGNISIQLYVITTNKFKFIPQYFKIKNYFIQILVGGNGRGSGSSPDSMGPGDTLTGCVSTPSSEALDQVSDLRHSRTLPKRAGGIMSNDNASINGAKVTRIKLYILI